jgi:hypothetical protein
MFQKIVDHFSRFRAVYLVLAATLMTMAGLASYQKGLDFYAGNSRWLLASTLGAPRADAYTHGEFVIDVLSRLKKTTCFQAQCADMKGGMPDEVARCELEKLGVFDNPPGYDWYNQEFGRAEALKIVVKSLKVPVLDNAKQPFKDVPNDSWFAPYLAAAYKGHLISNNVKHLFQPDTLATQKWVAQVLRKTNLKQFCVAGGTLSVAKAPDLSTVLINGENRLMGFSAAAQNGNVGISTISFQVTNDPAITLSQFKLYRGPILIKSSTTPSFDLAGETVTTSNPQTYYLDGTVTGASINSSVSAKLTNITANASVNGVPTDNQTLTE